MPFPGERIGRFSFNTRRLFVGIALIPCVISLANEYFKFGIFGEFGKHFVGMSFLVLALVMRYLGPTMEDMEKNRGRK